MELTGSAFLGACIFGGLWTLGNEIRKGLIEAANVSKAWLAAQRAFMANAPDLRKALEELMAWNRQNVKAETCPPYDDAVRVIERIEKTRQEV